MNWFKRYGIVGMFFIVMTIIWLLCLFPENQELLKNSELLKSIGWFCTFSFLPFGYIIMIFSQTYYYLINRRNGIHRRYWRDLPNAIRQQILENEENLGLSFDWNDEAQIEAVLTYYDRTKIDEVDANQFLSQFATKRYDVLSINCGLIWAVILSLIVAFCIEGIILHLTIKWNAFSTWFVFIFALLSIVLLNRSERIMENQIFEVGRRKLRDINLNGPTNQSNGPNPTPEAAG